MRKFSEDTLSIVLYFHQFVEVSQSLPTKFSRQIHSYFFIPIVNFEKLYFVEMFSSFWILP